MRAWIQRHSLVVAAALLAALVCAAYAGSLGNAPVWDDRDLATENPFLRTLRGLGFMLQTDLWTASAKREPSSFYRPLAMVTYWVNGQIAGISAASMRAGNVALHAGNAVLLLLVLRKLLQPAQMLLASMLAALWGVLALGSEPVLWISGRFDPLVCMAALLCLLANRAEGRRGVALVVAAAAGGVFSKESFVGWLPLLLLDDLLLLRRPVRPLVGKYAALAAVVAANFALRKWVGIMSLSVFSGTGLVAVVESYLFMVATFVPRVVVPFGLDPFHPYQPLALGVSVGLGLGLGAATGALGWAGLRKGACDAARVAAFGWAWFLLGLVPASVTGPNLFMVGDRYAYLPVVGLFVTAYAGLWVAVERFELPARERVETVLAGVLLVAGIGNAWALLARIPDWRNDRSLAEASLRAHPNNPYALYSLGTMAIEAGDLGRAEPLLRQALAGNPLSWRAHDAMCVLRLRQSRLEEARAACLRTLQIHPKNPRAWVNLASIQVREGQWQPALAAARRSIELKPFYPEARFLAALAAANLGQRDEAREHLRIGLEEAPDHPGLRDLGRQMRRRDRQ